MYNEVSDPFLGVEGGFDDILMGNFLHDIINTDQSDNRLAGCSTDILPDLLHFGFDEYADFSSSGLDRVRSSFAPMYSTATTEDKDLPISSHSPTETPAVRRAVHAGEQAFRESIWLWDPSMEDSSVSEQIHLTLPRDQSIAEHQSREVDWGLRLSAMSRDRLLSMILRTCEPRVRRQVESYFPSKEFLSCLLADFKTRHVQQISPWIHFPTLDLDNECEEFLAALICAGAADSRRPEIRRLGFALQEAARVAIMKRFEEDNRRLRDLRSIQALLLILNVGLNSASRRKIEIAESFTLTIVTMLRRGGRFWNKRDILSDLSDDYDGRQTLELHWKRWVEEESFKRLVYHVLFQDVQTSSALFRQPVLSYSEINLTMPCSARIWQAESAEIWWQEILISRSQPYLPPLTLQNCLQDPGLLSRHHAHVDVQMSIRAMVSMFWLRVWQFIQIRAIFSPEGSNPDLGTVNYLRQQLVATSQDLIVRFSEGSDSMHPCVKMMLELGLMYLHVSLEDIQHLAGKEGEEQARKAASRLRLWISLPESRHALFHAGQIAKAAAQCPLKYQRGFHATIIYHASLTMWAYALLATRQTNMQPAQAGSFHSDENKVPMVQLDGDEAMESRRFILLGTGLACIRKYPNNTDSRSAGEPRMVPLTDAAEVMMSMAALLSSRDEGGNYCIPIVSYLTRLMHSLAKASAAMKLLRLEN
ncbi:hypothetical protein H2198_000283 [Neophaeococcomyces mojaviensis]|uniref:Uncharacterized protein n=1 Tax=Neophaeococcomyces mojaviensis TaxID=3383035 RepID=A0ACC3AK87_9EURO|nr:hypothetical protein H2198_000283 [Knufia sp. JES_112]